MVTEKFIKYKGNFGIFIAILSFYLFRTYRYLFPNNYQQDDVSELKVTFFDSLFCDWGMPIALILAYIEDQNIDINEVSHKSLENIYPEASNLSKTDKNFYTKALEISKQLNEQDKNRISQWKKIYNISTENIKTLLNKLDFKFDYYLGESDVVELIPDYIEELKEANLVKLDQGALIANDGQDPPALITKSDGSYMYLTTDIGTIIYREQKFNCDKYIYVVDQRQKNHFDQLFKLVRYFQLSDSEFLHVGFGTVNDNKGKPLKTRDGKNYKLLDLYKDIEDKLFKDCREKIRKVHVWHYL